VDVEPVGIGADVRIVAEARTARVHRRSVGAVVLDRQAIDVPIPERASTSRSPAMSRWFVPDRSDVVPTRYRA